MRPFEYLRADSPEHAARLNRDETTRIISGGTNLLDLMKLQVEIPETLVDVSRLPLRGIDSTDDGGLRIGALATNTETVIHERVRADYPLLARGILAGASQQLRNKATTGGNLCQRTRCFYFTNIDQPCNKRVPGSGCGALRGVARQHAVLGVSDQCIATYPGDMAVALAAIDATVELSDATGGKRIVPVRDFHRLPGDQPWRDNVLEDGEIITAVTLPPPVGGRQIYRKVRERSSYAFALVSAAAVIDLSDGKLSRTDLAFGALAAKPWHDPRLSDLMVGERPSMALFERAADLLLEGAQAQDGNRFKIPLARRTLIAVLSQATGVAE